MIDESSHVPPYNREDLTLPYINAIPMQPNGISGYASFPPETVISNQVYFSSFFLYHGVNELVLEYFGQPFLVHLCSDMTTGFICTSTRHL